MRLSLPTALSRTEGGHEQDVANEIPGTATLRVRPRLAGLTAAAPERVADGVWLVRG